MGGGLGTTHGGAVFVCRWGLLWGGALEQHTGPQSLFAGQAQSNIQGFVLFCEACNLI